MKLLVILFFATAVIYSSVGFGGGSTYTALLVLFDIDYRLVPVVSLSCNIVVVSAGAYYFIRHRLLDLHLLIALVSFSAPLSFLGGSLKLAEESFVLILGSALLLSAILLFMQQPKETVMSAPRMTSYWKIGALLGLPVGFVAGVTGIGGGIFLAPLLHLFRIAKAKTIAATACLFILINSVAGLVGQLSKRTELIDRNTAELHTFLLLPMAVLLGGLFGNRVAIQYFKPTHLRQMTALLILIVAIRLLLRWFSY